MPRKQILIYPALNNCYTEESPYKSVQENGEGYLLTAVKMEDYLKLYAVSYTHLDVYKRQGIWHNIIC